MELDLTSFSAIIKLRAIGLLHRDISIRNILLQRLNDELRGLLIDYDYCIRMSRKGSSALGHRTVSLSFANILPLPINCAQGTLPFLSIDSMNPNPNFVFVHGAHHDIESLFYVLIWICTTQSGPNGKARKFEFKKTELYVWNAGGKLEEGLRNIWDAKSNVVASSQDSFQGLVLDRMDPYFNPIKDCIVELKDVLFRTPMPTAQNPRPRRDVDRIPGTFLEVLDKHIQRMTTDNVSTSQPPFLEEPAVVEPDLFYDIKNTTQALMVPNRAMDVQILQKGEKNTLLEDFDTGIDD